MSSEGRASGSRDPRRQPLPPRPPPRTDSSQPHGGYLTGGLLPNSSKASPSSLSGNVACGLEGLPDLCPPGAAASPAGSGQLLPPLGKPRWQVVGRVPQPQPVLAVPHQSVSRQQHQQPEVKWEEEKQPQPPQQWPSQQQPQQPSPQEQPAKQEQDSNVTKLPRPSDLQLTHLQLQPQLKQKVGQLAATCSAPKLKAAASGAVCDGSCDTTTNDSKATGPNAQSAGGREGEQQQEEEGGQATQQAGQQQLAAFAAEAAAAAGASGSAAWPIAFTSEVEVALRACHMTGQRSCVQRDAASILRTLLQVQPGGLLTQELQVVAASEAGEVGVAAEHTFRMARKALSALGLLTSRRLQGAGSTSSRSWTVPAEAIERARAVVAAAEKGGAFSGTVQGNGQPGKGNCWDGSGPESVAAGATGEPGAAAAAAGPGADSSLQDAGVSLQQGGQCDADQAGEDLKIPLASLCWPLCVPASFESARNQKLGPDALQQTQRWAAAMLQALQGGPLFSYELAAKAASAIGLKAPNLSRDHGGSAHSSARHLLKFLGLVKASKSRGNSSLLWSLTEGTEVAAAAARVVAAARAAGKLQCSAAREDDESGDNVSKPGASSDDASPPGWPLRLPQSVLAKGKLAADGKRRPISPDMQARVRRFGAAILHVLLTSQRSMPTRDLAAAVAAAAGEGAQTCPHDLTPFRLGHQALQELKLVQSERRSSSEPFNWSIPPEARKSAASLVAQARAAGDLSLCQGSQAAPAAGQASSAVPPHGQGSSAGRPHNKQTANKPAGAAAAAGKGTKRQEGGKRDRPAGTASQPGSKAGKQDAKRKRPAERGKELIGRSIYVRWDDGFTAYRGSVVGFDAASGLHTVQYEDGDVQRHNLAVVQHELLPSAQPVEGPPSKRSKGGGAAAPATQGAAPRSSKEGGGKRQKQQQAAPAQAAGAAGATAAGPHTGPAVAAAGGSAAPQLLPHNDPAVAELLAGAAEEHLLMPIVELLLKVADWAGVPAMQSADFGDAFLELPPAARLLWYRRLWKAASQQDAHGVRQLMVGDGAPGRSEQLGGKA